jgi:oligopeptide transport system substrate-binding protein
MRTSRSGTLACLCAAPLLVFMGLTGCDSGQQHGRNELHRSIGGEPSTLDPGKAEDTFSNEVIEDLFEGLVAEAPDGSLEPGVAESWAADAEGTQYTFRLRADARWSNGQRVTAGDFVRAWRRVVDPKEASPDADFLRIVRHATEVIDGKLPPTSLGVTAAADDRLVVELEAPAPYFPSILTHPGTFPIYSAESVKTHDPTKFVSNGAYVFSSWILGGALKIEKNPTYWRRAEVAIPKVTYTASPDEATELSRYRAGEVDVTESVPAEALSLIRRDMPHELVTAPIVGTVYYAINLRTASLGAGIKLRQALTMALDRRMIQKNLLPFGQAPAYGFVAPGALNYAPQSWDWKDLSDAARLEAARSLYRQAGYDAAHPLHLRLLFNSSPMIKRLSVEIAGMWHETLGVDAELLDEEYRVFLVSRRDPGRWDIARLAWIADYNDASDFLDTFRTGSPNNDSGYSNRQYDALLDQAAREPIPDRRAALLEQAERLMLADYPVIPIYFYASKHLVKPYVVGVRPNALNRIYSKHLHFVE